MRWRLSMKCFLYPGTYCPKFQLMEQSESNSNTRTWQHGWGGRSPWCAAGFNLLDATFLWFNFLVHAQNSWEKWHTETKERQMSQYNFATKAQTRDFSGSPVIKNPWFHCRGHGFDSLVWELRMSHAAWQQPPPPPPQNNHKQKAII